MTPAETYRQMSRGKIILEGGWRTVSASTIGGAEEQDSAHDLPSVRAEVERLFQMRDEVGYLTHAQYERYQELVEREQQLRAVKSSD